MTLWRTLVLPLLLAAALPAQAGDALPSADAKPRFTLRSAQLERGAQGEGRYAVRARLAPRDSAGELREGGNFALIGRLQKAGAAACGSGTVFKNGFEGN